MSNILRVYYRNYKNKRFRLNIIDIFLIKAKKIPNIVILNAGWSQI